LAGGEFPKIHYKASVAGDLKKLDRAAATRVLTKIEEALLVGGRPGAPLAGEFAALFRLRIGDYRVIYVPTRDGYLILRIGHRRQIYRKGRFRGESLITRKRRGPVAMNPPGTSPPRRQLRICP
jgi:mRNA interferase RelE/StbE